MSLAVSSSVCCCGRPDCAYLQHNDTALGGLERDLDTAARLGQALLSRHESYITESQAEHARLSAQVSELEHERTSLQSANEKIVAENRDLLSRLETLNSSLATSDSEVKRLEDLLLDCELELKRLNGLVRRAEDLDGKVHEMEKERFLLNRQISEGRDEARGTLARWRDSERKVRELEEDMRRIEREARAERDKHEAIMARMDKERALERELGGAEGRLKGAAAVQSMKSNAPGSKNIVSHFVRDILQDNANLQAGIAELRELLQSSNEEVQNLREQILLHQPVLEDEGLTLPGRVASLSEELAEVEPTPKQVQQEVHVHHHYHAKIAKKEKQTSVRRPGKRRAVIPNYGYASDASGPSTPLSKPQRFNTSPVVPMSLHHPQPKRNQRWSMQSTATQSSVFSSMPSSPRSYFERGSSLFDRIEQGDESSRPTSPESVTDMLSPDYGRRTRSDDVGIDIFDEESGLVPEITTPKAQETIDEEPLVEHVPEPQHRGETAQASTPKASNMLELNSDEGHDITPRPPDRELADEDRVLGQSVGTTSVLDNLLEIRPSLARRGSHESLVSISGMDIHLAQRASPSTMLQLLRGNSSHFALSPAQTSKISAAAPLASVTEYNVLSSDFDTRPLLGSSMRRMPSGIEALSGIAVPAPRPSKPSSSTSGGLSNLVGGWVRGKWGIAPTRSVAGLRSLSASQTATATAATKSDDSHSSSASSVQTTVSAETDSASQPGVSDNEALSSSSSSSAATAVAPNTTPSSGSTSRRLDTFASTDPNSVSYSRQPFLSRIKATNAIAIPGPRTNLKAPVSLLDLAYMSMGRPSGVNQSGFIPGFRAAVLHKPTPSDVVGQVIDEEALRDGLRE